MSANPNLLASLHWVQGELAQSLTRVRTLVEQHMETPANQLPLQQAVVELHQVRGTASMIQCSGLAALTDEMKAAVQDLLQGRISEGEAAYAALLGATLQLGDYIDALAGGMDDSVMVFQPVINELRLARGKPVIGEAELFAEQLGLAATPVTLPPGEARKTGVAQDTARKFQLVYQQNLLQWIKGADVQLALGRLGKVAEQIAASTVSVPVYQLWRMVAAVAEALLTKGLDDASELRRLYGRAGAQLKLLAEQGEEATAAAAGTLPFQFLYYIARSRSQGPRVTALRNVYPLARLLPTPEAVENLRQKIRGPNTTLLNKLSEEIRKDLTQVKDAIDLTVRAGDKAPAELKDTVEKLGRVAVTLNMLGLGSLQAVIQAQAVALTGVNPQNVPATDPLWLDVATALLRVEHSLDDALVRQLRRSRNDEADDIASAIPMLDVREGRAALVRESLVDLARLKGLVDGYLKTGDAAPLPEAGRLLGNLDTGLRVLQSERAASLMGVLRGYALSPSFAFVRKEKAQAERFADAVAGIEYYLEALKAQAPDTERLVDHLAAAVERLDIGAADLAPAPPPGLPAMAPIAPLEPATAPAASAPAAVPAPAVNPEHPLSQTMRPAPREEVDPEIRDIFLGEADEVLGSLREYLPKLKKNANDRDTWAEARRGFHTLKGSGRMVGARDIGEFAWAVEHLLNRCLEGTRTFSPPVIELFEAAIGAMPGTITAFRDGTPLPEGVMELQNRAHRLAKGDDAGPDQELVQVFCIDARERLATMRHWLEVQDDARPEHTVDETIARGLHTLLGAAAVIKAKGIETLSGELETYLLGLREAKLRLPATGLKLLKDAALALSEWVERIAAGNVVEPDLKPWLARVTELKHSIPAEAIAAAAQGTNPDTYAHEAFTRLEGIEAALATWRRHPAAERPPLDLREMFTSLRSEALTAQCGPLARCAEAFAHRITVLAAQRYRPDPLFLDECAKLVEGMYSQLDDFRERKLEGDGTALAARMAQLGTAPPEPVAPAAPVAMTPEEEVLEMPPVAEAGEAGEEVIEMPEVEAMDSGVDPEIVSIFLAEGEGLLEQLQAQVEALEQDPQAREPLAEMARTLHTMKGGANMAEIKAVAQVSHRAETLLEQVAQARVPRGAGLVQQLRRITEALHDMLDLARRGGTPDAAVALQALDARAATAGGADPELLSLFLNSAIESLQNIDQLFDAWERDPHSTPVLTQLTRTVHALKGSANTAGFLTLGEVAHQIKQLLDRVNENRVQREAGLYGRLHNCMDELHAMLEQIGRGEPPDPAPALAELEGIVVAPLAPPPAAAASSPAQAAAASSAAAGDAELVQIFTTEAGELLEVIESSLTAWQADASNEDALREVQRALHTLKGGARMSGIMAMGTVAHDMESRVEEIAETRGPLPAESLSALHSHLEQLQQMQDRLVRGGTAALPRETPAAEVAARAAPEPKVEHYSEPAPKPAVPTGNALRTVPAPPAGPGAAQPPAAPGAPAPKSPWDASLFWRPDTSRDGLGARQRETARVAVEQLDKMLNDAGEISIYRARLEQHNNALQFQLDEMQSTLTRVRDHLRAMDIETETQIAARGFNQQIDQDNKRAEFDPLEMDRYSRMQELSRTLAESVGDLAALRTTMDDQLSEADTLLLQQGRVNTEIQQGLMATLMVPFSRQVQRLQRVVRQTAADTGKKADVKFEGIEAELDRNVLERMVAPLEHLLRNSVVHGIETPEKRNAAGKLEQGLITVTLRREGTQLAIEVKDDGQGLNYAAIRKTAVERGLMAPNADIRDQEVAMFIFEAGFSTAREVTQAAGRGIGMDVVASEVKQLGGTLELSSEKGKGARFLIRLPLTLALSQVLLVGVGVETYAIPLPSIESIARVSRDKFADYQREGGPAFTYGGQDYKVYALGDLLEAPSYMAPEDVKTLPAVLVRLGEGLTGAERRVALVVDTLFGNREIVSKAVGPQVSAVQGVSGGTILPDGRVVLILDAPALVANRARRAAVTEVAAADVIAAPLADERQTVMVVDDSITIRRVTERLLERAGYRVVLAKDGLDAMTQLQTESPGTMLLDIEMPRADGFEVATFVRNNERLRNLPIIMITSRSGEKHRERARQIGVNRYLIKPYQEEQLLTEVRDMLEGVA